MKTIRCMGLLLVVLASLVLSACGRDKPRMQGVNMMQSESVSFADVATGDSIRNLRKLGANTLALVPLLYQASLDAVEIEPAGGMDLPGLRRAIRWAKSFGMQVVLKPQLLVPGSWAGEIAPVDWAPWFANYGRYLDELAQLAMEEQVEMLVIGTELERAARQPQWLELIERLRQVYPGRLSYVAHGVEGVRAFAFWDRLDVVGLSLFPYLGEDMDQAAQQIRYTCYELRQAARALPLPVWVAEVGIASRKRATLRPWAWQDLTEQEQKVDLKTQAEILDLWLEALQGDWLDGVLIWAWSSDPDAGGTQDNGFTPQHKPAERVLACYWSGRCR